MKPFIINPLNIHLVLSETKMSYCCSKLKGLAVNSTKLEHKLFYDHNDHKYGYNRTTIFGCEQYFATWRTKANKHHELRELFAEFVRERASQKHHAVFIDTLILYLNQFLDIRSLKFRL